MCTTDEVSALIEELQFTLGEGPCVDAYRRARPVVEPDLADPAVRRWPFTPPAVHGGARAVFGFPLRSATCGSARSTSTATGPARSPTISTPTRSSWPASPPAPSSGCRPRPPPGTLGAELEAGGDFQFVVHQAAGMVAVQLGVRVTEALIRLRAPRLRNDRLVADVARDVVARRLRFAARAVD